MGLNFANVEEAKAIATTPPGTIDVFEIKEVKWEFSKNKGTQFMGVTFARKDDSFRHSFYVTEKALGRIKSLVKHATGTELGDNVEENALTAMLTGKKVGLRVSGKVGDNGKGYPDLPFGGFCTAAAKVSELSFTSTEQAQINKALDAIINGGSSNPDTETTSGNMNAGAAPTSGTSVPSGKKDDDIF